MPLPLKGKIIHMLHVHFLLNFEFLTGVPQKVLRVNKSSSNILGQ